MLGEDMEEEEVRQMTAAQIFSLAGQMQVDLSGCSNTEQFRERVLLHLRVQKGLHYDLQREFGDGAGESADSTRQTLDGLLDNVQAVISQLTPTLEHALRADFGGGDNSAPLGQQIQRRRRSLVTSECSVIVAGETNAGKSTFLNLLLGLDVLPTSIFSCTAAACVLRHSPTFRAHIHRQGGGGQGHQFQDALSTKQWLETMVAEQNLDKREQGLDITSIHVYLPSTVLQSGVTLVDTPGIGENEAMTQCTMDYVKRHSAAAYLYIIKTDNGGGIHEDRLLDFLRAILQHNEQNRSAGVFNSSAAMFVCNRWDQVPVDQRERVRDNALSKLKDVWPGFESRQAFFMSSTNAQMHYDTDPRYVTQDFEQVLRGLKEMFVQGRLNSVNQHYRWLKQFLHASTSFLQTAVHHCAMTDDQLMARFRTTRQKLQALEQHTTTTTSQLRHHVQQAMQGLCGDIRQMLQEEEMRTRLMDWDLQLPHVPATFASEEVQRWQEEVDTLIMKRIMDTVDGLVRQKGLDEELHNDLKNRFQEELKLMDEEINSIVSDMKDTTSLSSSTSSTSSCMSTELGDDRAQELLRLYRERDGFRLGQLRHVSRVTRTMSSNSTSPEATMSSVPKVLVARLVSRILGPLQSLTRRVRDVRRASQFGNDPGQYMRERTDKMVRVVCSNEGCLEQVTAKYHHKMDAFISDVENSIPTFIASNQQQMEDIRMNRKNYLSQRNEMISLMESMEPTRHMLQGFGALYIRDLTANNICFVLDVQQRKESVAVKVKNPEHREHKVGNDSVLGDSKHGIQRSRSSESAGPWASTTGGSLWSTFRRGHVTIGEQKEDVMGRTYVQAPAEHCLIKEIARLRCVRCEHLAPFLGMTRQENHAVFLFLGALKSARRFLRSGFHNPSESIPRLLEGVVQGLRYLHREGLVHMELSLDTVMVDTDGESRLCGACLPRRARLPPDAHLICAEPFVCLSPEVLRDELYTSEDDVYSLGLVVWEACLPDKPYGAFRSSLSLHDFRRQVHPSSMLALDTCTDLSPTMAAILRGCLLPARGLRVKVEELLELVPRLRSDPQVLSLSSAQRRAHINNRRMKRASSDDSPSVPSLSDDTHM